MRKKGKTEAAVGASVLPTQRQPLAPDGPPDGVEVIGIVPCSADGADPNGPWWYMTFKLSEQRVNELFLDENVAWQYKESAKKMGGREVRGLGNMVIGIGHLNIVCR